MICAKGSAGMETGMTPAEEYILSEYQDLGSLNENPDVHIVRNKIDGRICVKKSVRSEQRGIYEFFRNTHNTYIPRIYEMVPVEDHIIVIEEYLTGKNLEECLREKKFTECEAAGIIIRLCRALAPLHHASPAIICRDLKPANVILTLDGKVMLVDFDIARTYQAGKNKDTALMGTQGFAAPEQFGFGQTDPRTDIYGLGVMLNYLITGCFLNEQMVTGRFRDIVQKCTAMNSMDRYQNVFELEQALFAACPELKEMITEESGTQSDGQNNLQTEAAGGTLRQKNTWEKSADSYRIPGFRTKTPWKMITACVGYFLVSWFCFTLEFKDKLDHPLVWQDQIINRVLVWLSQIVTILFVWDYRNCRSRLSPKIPLVNNRHAIVRGIGYILSDFLFLVAAASICAIIEAIV